MEASSSWAGAFKVWVGLSRRPLLVRTSGARFNVVPSDVYFWAASRKRRYQLPEKGVINPDQVLSALKRYLEESGDTEQGVASKIGVNHHTLHRWLSDQLMGGDNFCGNGGHSRHFRRKKSRRIEPASPILFSIGLTLLFGYG